MLTLLTGKFLSLSLSERGDESLDWASFFSEIIEKELAGIHNHTGTWTCTNFELKKMILVL